ncbi:MAG: hypothetical protein IJK42_06840 [Prevotella sp.]|nr:hypothetical protein [Prevotella sp.]
MANKFSFSNMFSKSVEDAEAQEVNGHDDSHAFSVLKDRVRTLQRRVDEMEKRIETLEKMLAEKDKEVKEEPVVTPTAININPVSQPTTPIQEPTMPKLSQFYLAAPSADGSFPSVSQREQIGKSIYVLTTQDGLNGTFSIIDSNDAIATAMISISQFLKPVCKVNGSTAQYPHHIVTDEEGTASKEGGVWKVVRKAIVHFE